MEGYTKIIWDFLETAFRTGTLDKILDLVNLLTADNPKDLAQTAADIEDIFMEMEDSGPMEEKFAGAYLAMAALTDEDILDGIGTILSMATPVIGMVMAQAGGDGPATPEKKEEMKKKAGNVFKALRALGGIGMQAYMVSLGTKPAREKGQKVGNALNTLTAVGNSLIGEKDEFMAGVFDTLDSGAMQKMADSIQGGFSGK